MENRLPKDRFYSGKSSILLNLNSEILAKINRQNEIWQNFGKNKTAGKNWLDFELKGGGRCVTDSGFSERRTDF